MRQQTRRVALLGASTVMALVAAGAVLTGAGSAGAAGPDPIAGTTFAAVHSGKCLNVKGGGEANGTPVQQYRCVGATNERWSSTPDNPPLPVDPAPRSSLLQSAPGAPLQLAHVDGYGKAYYGTAKPAVRRRDLVGAARAGELHRAAGAAAGRQRRAVLALGLSNNVWGRSGPQPASAGWLGTGGPVQSPPVTASAPDGRRYAFATDLAGTLWWVEDDGVHLPYQSWRRAAASPLRGAQLAAVTGRDGVQLFGVTPGGVLVTAAFAATGTSWTTIGTGVAGVPAAVTLPGRRPAVAVRGTDGSVRVKFAAAGSPMTWPAQWTVLGGLATVGSPAMLLDQRVVAGGRVWVYARGGDGSVHASWETTQASQTFRPWQQVSAAGDVADTDPTVFEYTAAAGQQPSWGVAFRRFDNRTILYYVTTPPATDAASPVYTRTLLTGPA